MFLKNKLLHVSCFVTLLALPLFGYGTSKSSQKKEGENLCSIRLFSLGSIKDANAKLLHVSAEENTSIELFNFKNRFYIAQYGQSSDCSSLKSKLQDFKKRGFKTAYFVSYNPKKTSLTKVEKISKTVQKQIDLEPLQQSDTNKTNRESTPTEENSTTSIFENINSRGTVGAVFNSYSTDKTEDTLAVEGNVDFSKEFEVGKVSANLAFLYDGIDHRRRYALINELYFRHYMEDSFYQVGRSVRNWGALEAFSMSDVFNTKNYLSDSFDMSNKYGAFNVEYTKNIGDNKFSAIIKAEELSQPYPADDNVYNFYHYNNELDAQKGKYRPTIYLKYSGSSSGEEAQSDYTLILQNGYDNKRDIVTEPLSGSVVQKAYIVNKLIGYATVAIDQTIYKLEASYANVEDYSNMSDYLHFGAGLEYLPSQIIGGAELRLLAEYYQYYYFNDNKVKNVDFSEIFNHDIFVGAQSTFGDAGSSEIKGGLLYDVVNKEQIYALTFGTRLKQNYRLSMEWKVVVPGSTNNTAIGQMGQFNQATFRASYFF
jgi:hypothetical protein